MYIIVENINSYGGGCKFRCLKLEMNYYCNGGEGS
jgi:hypothetical protein